jgi:lipopolysaccharide/colanic/teichoic acid biosynthesis glycosyltransferase
MSLVGPRPFRRSLQSDHPLAEIRFLVKPGLTGPWQISGRKNTTFDQAVTMELEYIRKPSLLADLKILARTIPVVLRTRHGGAR